MLGALSFAGGNATAQVESGPRPGEKPVPFKAYVTTGPSADKAVDLVGEHKDKPTVFLFVQNEHWNRPVARVIKTLDGELEKGIDGAEGASAVAVWLTDEVEASKSYQPRAQQSLMLARTTLSVFEGPRAGPEGWSLYDTVPLTAVVVRGGKVVKSFPFDVMDESPVAAIVKSLKGQ
jgi:hypothetical protein